MKKEKRKRFRSTHARGTYEKTRRMKVGKLDISIDAEQYRNSYKQLHSYTGAVDKVVE